jgi:hypothetical protein
MQWPQWLSLTSVVLVVLWCVFWLWAVNWRRTWSVLSAGAWVPVVLLVVVATLAWSRLAPDDNTFLGIGMPNFWAQLACVCALALLALFCGWLQTTFEWYPADVSLEPPAHHGPHDHSLDFEHHPGGEASFQHTPETAHTGEGHEP